MNDAPPPAGIPADAWAATPLTVRYFIGAMLTVVDQQQQQLVHLHTQVADLTARLQQHSQNSSASGSRQVGQTSG